MPSRFCSQRAGYFLPIVSRARESAASSGMKPEALTIAPSMTMLTRDLQSMAIFCASTQVSSPACSLSRSRISSGEAPVLTITRVSSVTPAVTGSLPAIASWKSPRMWGDSMGLLTRRSMSCSHQRMKALTGEPRFSEP